MRKIRGHLLSFVLVFGLIAAACSPRDAVSVTPFAASIPAAASLSDRHSLLSRLPIFFVENGGQVDPHVDYVMFRGPLAAYFTGSGVAYTLTGPRDDGASVVGTDERGSLPPRDALQRWSIAVDFVGADRGVHPVGVGDPTALVSYFKGPESAWHVGLPAYPGVAYHDIWPGIDLVYGGDAGHLKSELIVHPGADPNGIRLAYRGATDVRVDSDGDLVVETPIGGLREGAPYAYQEQDGRRVQVEAGFVPDAALGAGGHGVGFGLGSYDPSRPLVIDPAVQVFMRTVGTPDWADSASAVAVDRNGFAYLAGFTLSSEQDGFPVTPGVFDPTFNGPKSGETLGDAFVAKLRPDGSIVYLSYLGGALGDAANGIAVDDDGNAYVVGETWSQEDTFPVRSGPDVTFNGRNDGFIAKVNAAGTALVYAGYIGGAFSDTANGVAVDIDRAAYVIGTTSSDNTTFPNGTGLPPELPSFRRTGSAGFIPAGFVVKVRPDGGGLAYAGYIDGDDRDFSVTTQGRAIAVDRGRNAYVTGKSSASTLPVTGGPDPTLNDPPDFRYGDAFVGKILDGGTAFGYLGFIGGAWPDEGNAIAVDAQGYAYVAGMTFSDQATFPVTPGAFDTSYNGPAHGESFFGGDAFVAKVDRDGSKLLFTTYLGGRQADVARAIALSSDGSISVVGDTLSDQNTFPVRNGPDATFNGVQDGFVARLSGDGSQLQSAGYLGTALTDGATGVAVDPGGAVYISGLTFQGSTFPGQQLTDAWLAKVATPCEPRPKVLVRVVRVEPGRLQVTITADASGNTPDNRVRELQFGPSRNALIDLPNGQTGLTGNVVYQPPASGPVTFFVRRATPSGGATVPLTVVDACGSWRTFVGGGDRAF